jgi:hypothetical protein
MWNGLSFTHLVSRDEPSLGGTIRRNMPFACGTSAVSFSSLKRSRRGTPRIHHQHAQNATAGYGLAAPIVSAPFSRFPAITIRDARIAICFCSSGRSTNSDRNSLEKGPTVNQTLTINPSVRWLRPQTVVFQLVTPKRRMSTQEN